jgi:hypothetical protein
MRNFLFLITTLYAAVQAYTVLEGQLDRPAPVSGAFLDSDVHKQAGPRSDEVCATGCSVGNHPVAPLSPEELAGLFDVFSSAHGKTRESALDTLLFHGGQVRESIDELGAELLSPDQAAFLRRELDKTHARVWMRIVDEHGIMRASVDGHRFPIGTKEHVHLDKTHDLPAPEISGTVHRTGLHHLWTRI